MGESWVSPEFVTEVAASALAVGENRGLPSISGSNRWPGAKVS